MLCDSPGSGTNDAGHGLAVSPSPHRRRARRLAALLLSWLLATALAGAGVLATAPAVSAQSADAAVELEDVSRTAPGPDGTVRASGTITNTGDVDLHEVTATFWIDSTALRTRAQLAEVASERPGDRLAERLTEPYDLIDQVGDQLAPGQSAPFELDIPAEALDLSEEGSYLIGVDVLATIPPVGDRDTLARVRTYLPLVPNAAEVRPIQLALVVPLVAEPVLAGGGRVIDKAAARTFAPEGRLQRLLDLAEHHEVTWLVDPALLDQASTLASGARYVDGTPVDDRVAQQAREWLDRAQRVLNDTNTLWLPYADPDLSALRHHDLVDRFDVAVSSAETIAAEHDIAPLIPAPESAAAERTPSAGGDSAEAATPGGSNGTNDATGESSADETDQNGTETDPDGQTPSPPEGANEQDEPEDGETPGGTDESEPEQRSTVFAWPGSGFADADTLETIAVHGSGGAILSQEALPELPRDGSAPTASLPTPAGPVTTLVADPTLTAGGPPGDSEGLLARQRMLSETALLARNQRPGTTSQAVAVLPRNWEPDEAGEAYLDAVETAPWLEPTSAHQLLTQPPRAHGGPVRYPERERDQELGQPSLRALESFTESTNDYLSMVPEPGDQTEALARDFLRGASVAWRRNPDRGVALLEHAARSRISTAQQNVSVLSLRFVTLSGTSGSFPVTIENENDFPVEVMVDVDARVPGLLDVARLDPIRIPPNRRETEAVSAEVIQGGVVQVEVGLSTPGGTSFGQRQDFAVRATDYGLVGWGVLGVGIGLLFLAATVRIIRRVRAGRATDLSATSGSDSTSGVSDGESSA